MSTRVDWDLADLQRRWRERRAALAAILQRFDTRGMTRPARDADERRWIEAQGASQFVEDEACGAAARAYYSRRYTR